METVLYSCFERMMVCFASDCRVGMYPPRPIWFGLNMILITCRHGTANAEPGLGLLERAHTLLLLYGISDSQGFPKIDMV